MKGGSTLFRHTEVLTSVPLPLLKLPQEGSSSSCQWLDAQFCWNCDSRGKLSPSPWSLQHTNILLTILKKWRGKAKLLWFLLHYKSLKRKMPFFQCSSSSGTSKLQPAGWIWCLLKSLPYERSLLLFHRETSLYCLQSPPNVSPTSHFHVVTHQVLCPDFQVITADRWHVWVQLEATWRCSPEER